MARKKNTVSQDMQEDHDAIHGPPDDSVLDEPATEEKQLSAQEQLEAMRLYVQSMQKTDGHSNEEVRGIVTSIHKRFLVVLNYSGLSDSLVKPLKVELQKIVDEEQERYKDG